MKVYQPNGSVFDLKDDNFIVSDNEHHNTSFSKDENGNWKANSNWTWTRDPDNN